MNIPKLIKAVIYCGMLMMSQWIILDCTFQIKLKTKIGIGCFRMIEEYRETIGHGRGYPTGLSHEEKMDVIACLLDEGERTYVNEEHAA